MASGFDDSEWQNLLETLEGEDEHSPRRRRGAPRPGPRPQRKSPGFPLWIRPRPPRRPVVPVRPIFPFPWPVPTPYPPPPTPPETPAAAAGEPRPGAGAGAADSACSCQHGDGTAPPDADAEPAVPDADATPSDGATAQDSELEPRLGPFKSRVQWTRIDIAALTAPGIPDGPGAFIVVDSSAPAASSRPLYVGWSTRLGAIWRERLTSLHQLGLTDARGTLRAPISVWFGAVTPMRGAARSLAHALVRVFSALGLGPPALRNATARPLPVAGRIVIDGLLPPPYLRPPFAHRLGQVRHLAGNTFTLNPGGDSDGA